MHCNWRTKQEYLTQDYMPLKDPVNILITSGASCPDALVEEVIEKLAGFFASEKDTAALTQEFV